MVIQWCYFHRVARLSGILEETCDRFGKLRILRGAGAVLNRPVFGNFGPSLPNIEVSKRVEPVHSSLVIRHDRFQGAPEPPRMVVFEDVATILHDEVSSAWVPNLEFSNAKQNAVRPPWSIGLYSLS
jgi:hypothetical protein